MDQTRRTNVAFGVILLLLGIWFLLVQAVPGLSTLFGLNAAWPLIIVGVGAALLVFGIVAGIPALAIPASIVAGVGAILFWQNVTGNWESWAYIWTLFPGFVGVGMVVMGLLGHETRHSISGGAWLIVISLVLLFVFGSFLGGWNLFGPYWPVLLIALGVLLLARAFLRYR